MKKESIKFKIPLFILIFSLSCIIITALIFQIVFQRNLEENMMTKNMIISKMISEHIDQYLEDATDTLITASNFSSASFGDLDKIEDEIFRIYDNFKYFDLIFFMNANAKMVFSKPDNAHVKGRDYRDRSYYWDIIRDHKEATISPLLVSSVLQEPHFIIAGPVYNRSHDIIGLIGAGLPLYNLENVVNETQSSFEGKIWIVDQKGTLVLHPDVDTSQGMISIDILGQSEIEGYDSWQAVQDKGENTLCNYTINDENYYAAVSFAQNSDWMIVVEQDEKTLFSDIYTLQNQIFKLVIGFSLLAVFVGLFLAKSITTPIEKLVVGVRKFTAEIHVDEDSLEAETSQNEIEELDNAFSEMSFRLKDNLDQLKSSLERETELQQYLNDILRSVKLGILVVNKEKVVAVCNREAELITQYEPGTFIGEPVQYFAETTQLNIEEQVEHVLSSDHTYHDMDFELVKKDGSVIPVKCTFSKVLDNHSETVGVVLQFRDMTRIKRIEEELRRGDRIRTIGELSAGIIHDLGNPLAGMTSLIEILRTRECSSETQNEILKVLDEEIKDLNDLVIGFLEFTKNATLDKKQVNIAKLLDHTLGVLKNDLMTKEIQLKKRFYTTNIQVFVDRNLIKQVIYNILKNAIQAMETHGQLVIELSELNAGVQIVVKDNGVGMTTAEMEHIFSPFFSTKEDGNGLGMFISYNIIREHEGTIEINSTKEEGTVVAITLPKNEVKQ